MTNTLNAKDRAVLDAADALRIKLLDLSGRNQLLSFRHSERSRKHIRVVDIGLDTFFDQLNEGLDFRFYPLPEPTDEPPDEKTASFRRALQIAVTTDTQYKTELQKLGDNPSERAAARIERALRDRLREQLQLSKRLFSTKASATRSERAKLIGVDPSYELPVGPEHDTNGRRSRRLQTLLYPDELERKLRGIHEQARNSIEERGVNTLFAAIGFLEWYESETESADAIYAPLLLFAVEIKREVVKGQYVYSISASGDEASENLPLRERLKRDFDLALPELDLDKHTPDLYFRKVSSSIRNKRDWRVHRYLTIGHFEFTKLPMYHDLDRTKWGTDGADLAHHPVLSSILGGSHRDEIALIADEYEVDEPPTINNLPQLITDADSSQLSSIIDATAGKNLVIQGPPGTGKSQTITNLIAAALAEGKRVLFVAEKMAALEVVKNRLDHAGLGAFCLELHSYKARRRDVLDALKERIELDKQAPDPNELSRTISETNNLRAQLNRYASLLNKPFGSMGLTLHTILWRCHRLRQDRRLPDFIGEINLPTERALGTTQFDAEGAKELISRFEQHRAVMLSSHGALETHPWCGVRNELLSFVAERDLIRVAISFRQHVGELSSLIADLKERVGAPLYTAQELVSFISLVKTLPDANKAIRLRLLSKLGTEAARQVFSLFLNCSKSIREAYFTLQSAFVISDRALDDPSDLVNLEEDLQANKLGHLDLDGLVERAANAEAKMREVLDLANFANNFVHTVSCDLEVTPRTCQIAIRAGRLASEILSEISRRPPATVEPEGVGTASWLKTLVPDLGKADSDFDFSGMPSPGVRRLLELASSAQGRADNTKGLVDYVGQLIRCFSAELPLSPSTASVALRAAEHSTCITSALMQTCSPQVLAENGLALVSFCRQNAKELRDLRDELLKRFDLAVSVEPTQLRAHSAALRQNHLVPFLFRPVRQARRLYKRLSRQNRKLSAEQMAKEFAALADFKEAAAQFETEPRNQTLSSGARVTLDADFESYRAVAEWADQARTIFDTGTNADRLVLQRLLSADAGLIDTLATLLRNPSAESLRNFLTNTDASLREESLDNICNRLDKQVEDISIIAKWAERVEGQFADADASHRAAKVALLSGHVSVVRELTLLYGDPRRESLEALLINIETTSANLPLDNCCEPYVEAAGRLESFERRIRSTGILPTTKLSRLRTLGLTAAHLNGLLAACDSDEVAVAIAGKPFATDEDADAFTATLELANVIDSSLLPASAKDWLFDCAETDRIAELKALVAENTQTYNKCAAAARRFMDLSDLDTASWIGYGRLDEVPFANLIERLDLALASEEALAEWVQDRRLLTELATLGLAPIVDAFMDKGLAPTDLADAYELILFESLTRAAAETFPEIARFSGTRHGALRERFRELDKTLLNLQRKRLRTSLAQSPVHSGIGQGPKSEWTGLSLLLNEIGKQKRLLPIRRLIERAGQSIQQLKPCFMMSPLSIAQYLPPRSVAFDLVVMDEASQIRPEEALGAIMRGHQLVVVGDSKQLPPTRFFESTGDLPDEGDDEQQDVGNEESILDMAAGMFRPIRQLRWHYRSKHSDLIAFSNNRFYDDRLIIFPSPWPNHPDRGVELVSVKGCYQNGINPPEAEAVVRAAVDFIVANPTRSLGIVAMNVAQRDLLAEELDRFSVERSDVLSYRQNWQPTLYPLFVKNLENVQGDERDVIFISLTYGPNEAGHFYQRFGPINSAVGHRRLNVLFTRAREKIVVFTSMDPYQIQADDSAHQGVEVLRDYLLFASDKLLDRATPSRRAPDSDFEVTVASALKGEGFEVEHQIGVAGFFIDLAIRHPKKPGAFLLGIECDGAGYHSTRSARDRDRLRQDVLEDLGWKIHRIWSVDWIKNPKREIGRVANVARSLIGAS